MNKKILWTIPAIGAGYLLALKGRTGHEGLQKLRGWNYAHRGLHGEGVPENSLAAFRAAVDHGYGAEQEFNTFVHFIFPPFNGIFTYVYCNITPYVNQSLTDISGKVLYRPPPMWGAGFCAAKDWGKKSRRLLLSLRHGFAVPPSLIRGRLSVFFGQKNPPPLSKGR